MAVAPTGSIYKTLTFDGVSSADFGVYITGEAVFNAPQRDVEMVTIPGRNGTFALDNGRFENIEVSYPAGIFADTEADFAEAVSEFRNFLCSRNGYVRLEDDYNASEYRMAVYKSGLEVTPALLKAGEFTLTFDCKPQRWLTSGEEAVTVEWADVETETGDKINVEAGQSTTLISLSLLIEPTQSGSGTPSPSNIRPIAGLTQGAVNTSGKNMLKPFEDGSSTAYGLTIVSTNGKSVINGTSTSGWFFRRWQNLPAGTYTFSFNNNVSANINFTMADASYNELCRIRLNAVNKISTVTISADAVYWELSGYAGTNFNGFTLMPMAEIGETATDYEPYKAKTYTTSFGETVYGGTLDMMSGILTVTDENIAAYNGETLPSTWISDRDVYSAGATPTIGAQVVYKLATPTTIQLEPQDIKLLVGINNIWANGTLTVEYGEPYTLTNPTRFESNPLLEVTGGGTVSFNGYNIELENAAYGDVVVFDAGEGYLLSQTINFNKDVASIGDTVTIARIRESITVLPSASIAFYRETATGSGFNYNYWVDSSGTSAYIEITDVVLEVGVSNNIEYNVRFTQSGSSGTAGLTLKIAYDGDGSIALYSGNGLNTSSRIETWSAFILHSTRYFIDGTIYIDCDLGEAYKYEGGEIVSLNSYIDLGSYLPALASGDNEITFDNTITELQVIPRWWRV